MKKYNNKNKQISTELVEFFPTTPVKRAQAIVKESRWPFLIGLACAAAVCVGLIIGSGGLVVPGAAYLGTFKTAMATFVKRIVIGAATMTGFGIGFGLSKYFGIGKPRSKTQDELTIEQQLKRDDEEYSPPLNQFRPLKEPLPTQGNKMIVAFSTRGNWVKVRATSKHAQVEVSQPVDETFIPLRSPRHIPLREGSLSVTHYKRNGGMFLTYFNNQEQIYTLPQLNEVCKFSSNVLESGAKLK